MESQYFKLKIYCINTQKWYNLNIKIQDKNKLTLQHITKNLSRIFSDAETFNYYYNNQLIPVKDTSILQEIIQMISIGQKDFIFAFEIINQNRTNQSQIAQQSQQQQLLEQSINKSAISSPQKATGKNITIKYKNKILKIHVSNQQFNELTVIQFKQKVWNQIRSFHQDFLGAEEQNTNDLTLSSQNTNKSINNSQLDYQSMQLMYEDFNETIDNNLIINQLKSFNLCLKKVQDLQKISYEQRYHPIVQSLVQEQEPQTKLTKSQELNQLIENEQKKIDKLNYDKILKFQSKNNTKESQMDQNEDCVDLTEEQIEDHHFWNMVEILY